MTSYDDDYATDYDVTSRETERSSPRFDRSSSARYATDARYKRRRHGGPASQGRRSSWRATQRPV